MIFFLQRSLNKQNIFASHKTKNSLDFNKLTRYKMHFRVYIDVDGYKVIFDGSLFQFYKH